MFSFRGGLIRYVASLREFGVQSDPRMAGRCLLATRFGIRLRGFGCNQVLLGLAGVHLIPANGITELLFEHGYNVRDVLRCLHARVRTMQVDEALAVATALQSASSALGRLCAAHPADARDRGL